MHNKNLATNVVFEAILKQIRGTCHTVSMACDSCHTRQVMGMGKIECDSAFCHAKKAIHALAQQGYCCYYSTSHDDSKIALLTNSYDEKWNWLLIYYGEFHFMIIKAPKEFYSLDFDMFEYISLTELCEKLEW